MTEPPAKGRNKGRNQRAHEETQSSRPSSGLPAPFVGADIASNSGVRLQFGDQTVEEVVMVFVEALQKCRTWRELIMSTRSDCLTV